MPALRSTRPRAAAETADSSLRPAPDSTPAPGFDPAAHARFGHSLGQFRAGDASVGDPARPIQRQEDPSAAGALQQMAGNDYANAQAIAGMMQGAGQGSSQSAGGLFGGLQAMMSNDYRNAATLASQMQADNQQQQMERWKTMQDAQTRIFEVQQDVTANKAQTQDKAYKQWDEYVRL